MSPEPAAYRVAAFRQGLSQVGYVEGKSVAIEYRWAEGRYNLIRELVTDLLRRQVAIIATPGSTDAALAAKAATSEPGPGRAATAAGGLMSYGSFATDIGKPAFMRAGFSEAKSQQTCR